MPVEADGVIRFNIQPDIPAQEEAEVRALEEAKVQALEQAGAPALEQSKVTVEDEAGLFQELKARLKVLEEA